MPRRTFRAGTSTTWSYLAPCLWRTEGRAEAAHGFDLSHFEIDWPSQTVRCPTGQHSRAFPPTKDRFGQEVISVKFAPAACLLCPCREQCPQARARSLTFRPQTRYLALQSARKRESTSDFKEASAMRAGIESTIAQAVRVSDLRQARSFGFPKTNLQHLITATAINVRRLVSWRIPPELAPTQVSRLAALALKQSKLAA
jgi:transposase